MRAHKTGQTEGVKILIVEDDSLIQIAAQKTLRMLGCSVDVADNGREAIRLFQDNDYHLVFLDIAIVATDPPLARRVI